MVTDRQDARNPIRLLLHVPVPWVFVLTYLIGVVLEFAIPLHIRFHIRSAWLVGPGVVGAVLFSSGAAIAGWSLLIFRKAGTTTVPGRSSRQLVTWGPDRISRNPMYVALVLAYLGEAALLRQLGPVILLPATIAYIHWIVIPVEEARLREVFQEAYDEYRAHVRRWI
jgi:protein-S-isoprenylcysteine O-methyltransferase Ste14